MRDCGEAGVRPFTLASSKAHQLFLSFFFFFHICFSVLNFLIRLPLDKQLLKRKFAKSFG